MGLGPFDEVGHDEKVAGEFHAGDDAQLEIEPLLVIAGGEARRGPMGGEARRQTLLRLLAQFQRLGDLSRLAILGGRARGEARQDRLAGQGPVGAAQGDLDRVGGGLRQIGEELQHLRPGLEAMLGGHLPPVGLGDQRAIGDAEQGVMGVMVGAGGEEGLIGRHQRQAALIGEIEKLRLHLFFRRPAMALQFDIQAVWEEVLKRSEPLRRRLGASHGEQTIQPARGAAGQRDDAIGGAGEMTQQHMRGVARFRVEPGAAAQIHQVHVTALALGEQHDRAATEFALFVGTSAKTRPIAEIDRELDAHDGLYAILGELFGEFQRAKEIVGVRDGDRGLAVGGGEFAELGDGQRPLPQGEGGVHMQMHEADVSRHRTHGEPPGMGRHHAGSRPPGRARDEISTGDRRHISRRPHPAPPGR